jgi:hypothetical protein
MLSCFSVLIRSERNKSCMGSLNFSGLTDSFLLEPTECLQRWQTANVVAQWTLQENNVSTDLQMPLSFCSACFPRCPVPLRIILLSYSSIHIFTVLHLHYSNLLLKFSSVTHLPPHLHNHVSLFFVILLCRVVAKLQKMIISLVISVRLSVHMEQFASHWRTFMKFDISGFFLKTCQDNSDVIIIWHE